VDRGYNVGIVLGVVNPDGVQYFTYGSAALSGDQPLNESTVFEIGSISKVFTSILLADMVERGDVALDDPIQRYLPDSVEAPTRNGASITLGHLATQTSGLPRMPDNFAPADPTNPYADYSTVQMYEFLSKHTLRRDIGSQYEYSNYGVGLLGHLLERRAGMSYDELVRQRIAHPLGMPDTRIKLTPDMRDRSATGHSGSREVSNWDIPTLAGAGALRSTARDMLVFLAANIGLTKSPLQSAMENTHRPRQETARSNLSIGLGWHILTSGDRQIVWHNGGTGGYRSFAGFAKDSETGVVVLTNTASSADDIGFHFLDPSLELRDLRIPVDIDPTILERYVGKYQLGPGFMLDVTTENGKLLVQLTGQPRFQVFPQSETDFFYMVVDAQLTFVQEEDGQVTAVVLHQGGIDRTAQRLP
jgi:CubicO group peptidase (beta-lactamase class C family)